MANQEIELTEDDCQLLQRFIEEFGSSIFLYKFSVEGTEKDRDYTLRFTRK